MKSRSSRRASLHPKLRTRVREFTADAILEAAEEVFAQHGPEAGMDAIAQRAGLAVGTLYNHFRDRDALVDALFEARAGVFVQHVRAAIDESAGLALRARLVSALEAMVSASSPNARFRQVFFMAELRKPRKQAILDRVRLALAPVIEQAQRDGVLKPDPYRVQTDFLLAQLRAALMLSADTPNVLPRSAVAALVVDQFLDGARGVQP